MELGRTDIIIPSAESFASSMTACSWYAGSNVRLECSSCLLVTDEEEGVWKGEKRLEFSDLSTRSALSRETSAIRLQQNKAIALDSTPISYRQSNIVFPRKDAQPSVGALFHMTAGCNWLQSCAQNPPKQAAATA